MEANAQTPNPTASILVVDDEPEERKAIRALLEEAGFAAETVGDGEAALARLKVSRPALFIVDLMMPGMDGFALIKAVRHDPSLQDLPTILLTHRTTPLDGPGCGADMYLPKPFNPKELLAFVKRLLSTGTTRWDVYT